MWLILLLFLISLHVFQTDARSLFVIPIDYMHHKCLSLLPHTQFPQMYEALVCGKRIEDLDLHSVFVTTGLLHIFVVSGMHLSFLSKLFSIIKIPFILQALLLAMYALATSLHPPVVRAWFSLIIGSVKRRLLFIGIIHSLFGMCHLQLFCFFLLGTILFLFY